MKCIDIMQRNLEWIRGGETVQAAARLMRDNNIGLLPVCETDSRVIGVLTDRDIATRIVAEDKPAATPVSDIMTRQLVTCRPTDDVTIAEELMAQFEKSRIVITNERGNLLGIISLTDLLGRKFGRHSAQTARKVVTREAR